MSAEKSNVVDMCPCFSVYDVKMWCISGQ